ncbi:MAG: tripartite tricarboxylate transporter TctB family protein [Rhodospirillales bacterium]|nr:tripartite tricarboxylate transporter TctB family protein [Rhodospirillales bacterium]
MLRNINKGDMTAGLLIAAVGLFFFLGAFEHEIGTARRMGPGYLPLAVGMITVFLGLVISINSLRQADILPRLDSRPLISVMSAIIAFGLSFEGLGLVPAAMMAVIISSLGDTDVRPLPTAILSVVVAFGCWLIFTVALNLPFPAFRFM